VARDVEGCGALHAAEEVAWVAQLKVTLGPSAQQQWREVRGESLTWCGLAGGRTVACDGAAVKSRERDVALRVEKARFSLT
jgi:hypothetical protein